MSQVDKIVLVLVLDRRRVIGHRFGTTFSQLSSG
jgi:hypothetical protein